MTRCLLPLFVVLAIQVSVGCRPGHPPHTPQPFGNETADGHRLVGP